VGITYYLNGGSWHPTFIPLQEYPSRVNSYILPTYVSSTQILNPPTELAATQGTFTFTWHKTADCSDPAITSITANEILYAKWDSDSASCNAGATKPTDGCRQYCQ
jgi:hypothetical protein